MKVELPLSDMVEEYATPFRLRQRLQEKTLTSAIEPMISMKGI